MSRRVPVADAPSADGPARADVLVAGAGLVGLALAAALARSGLAVTLVDRAPVAAPEYDPATWDARVYAVSPGSARSCMRSARGRCCRPIA